MPEHLTALLRLFGLEPGERLIAIDEDRALRVSRSTPNAGGGGAVAIIPLQGVLRPRGPGSMALFRDRLNEAASSADVSAIIIDVDSPGGTVAGTPETAAAMRAAAVQKPVHAVVDSLCTSAAYWICSQATSIIMSPSADVGSIGVIALHMELAKALEQAGIKPTIIRSAPFKAEGNSFEPMTEAARANLQAEVDAAHSDFVRAVAEGRRTSMKKVGSDFGQGRTVNASAAIASGMADNIGTMADVLASLTPKTTSRRRAFAFA